MAGGYRPPSLDPYDQLAQSIQDLSNRLSELERPDQTQLVGLVAKVRAALEDLSEQVQIEIAANSYTKTQIDTKITSPGAITPTTVTASGAVQGSTGRFDGGLYSTDARNFVVVTNYAASWIDINGHFGISPSTLRFKKNIESWTPEQVEALLDLEPRTYRLSIPPRVIIRLNEEDGTWVLDDNGYPVVDQVIPGHEDPDDAPLRHGFIAEELVEAGVGFLVVRDDDGLPVSINYAEFTIVQQAALRWLNEQRKQHDARLLALEALVGGIE